MLNICSKLISFIFLTFVIDVFLESDITPSEKYFDNEIKYYRIV